MRTTKTIIACVTAFSLGIMFSVIVMKDLSGYPSSDEGYKSGQVSGEQFGYSIGQWDGMQATIEYLNETNQMKDTTKKVSIQLLEIIEIFKEFKKARYNTDELPPSKDKIDG